MIILENLDIFLGFSVLSAENRYYTKSEILQSTNPRIGTMFKKVFLKATMLSICLGATVTQAQEPTQQEQDKFGGVDAIINSLGTTDTSGAAVVNLPPSAIIHDRHYPEDNATKKVEPAPVAEQAENKGAVDTPTAEDRVLDTRVTEIPPGARFMFKRNLFLPSNKAGFLFLGGEPKFAIDSGADVNKILLMQNASSTPCTLISNKSNIMMRGLIADGKSRTHLDVDKISFSTMARPDFPERTYIKVSFEPKTPKGVVNPEQNSVQIALTCQLPKELGADYKKYRLRDINSTLSGLFDFSLPRYIEI
ncbi:MAG: hypothetical protein CL840_03710 [Crocinitomicaceae bacterium]|nr:hypothetical protein [Crocinitomicaceae bacterium]